VQKAVELKEMGNLFYKTKDYKKALGKYTLVQAYTRSIIPPDDKEAAAFTSATHAMEDQIEQAKELNSVTFLNMSLCYFHLGEWQKSIDKATLSLKNKKTYKAYYRRAKAHEKRNDFERAIQEMTEAVKMDPSDP
jgi:tetratricopeptide (TPR) repeat protein